MTVFVETAPEQAGDGPRLAVKDNIDVAGYVSGTGVSALAETGSPSEFDAPCVAQARDAGFRIVGKTAMSQLAIGAEGLNPDRGTPTNPADPRRVPGGSSSGSAAAVAAGSADVALGSDTGGSVRVPAACCGVVGLRFTPAAVSLAGVAPLAVSLDAVGVLVPTVAALSLAECWIGPAPAEPSREVRVGWLSGLAPELDQFAPDGVSRTTAVSAEDWETWYQAGSTVLEREAASHWWPIRRLWAGLADDVRIRLERGAAVTDGQAAAGYAAMRRVRGAIDEIFGEYDALALPALPHGVPLLDAPRTPIGAVLGSASTAARRTAAPMNYLTMPVNLLGLPAISLPVDDVSHPMPSIQLVGRPFSERMLVGLAQRWAAEEVLPTEKEGLPV